MGSDVLEDLKKEISDLKKRVAELEGKVQPVDVDTIIKSISQYFENELASIAHDTEIG